MKPKVLMLLARTGFLRRSPPKRVRQWIFRASRQPDTTVLEVSPKPRQLLIDVSVIHRHDAGTGIQRVVRSVLNHLEKNPPSGFTVRCVVANHRQPYRYADTLGQPELDKINVHKNDIFLGLDLCAHLLPLHFNQLLKWKLAGISFHFVVYDILPLTHPLYFTRLNVNHFKRWAKLLAILSDGLLCISHCVRTEVQNWLQQNTDLLPTQLLTTVIPLGGDLSRENSTDQPSKAVIEALAKLKGRPWALMVGTLEPRKGHAQVLDAFELLWQQGDNSSLVIVGRRGWKTDTLQQRILRHLQLNRNLFWFEAATDADLEKFYNSTTGVLGASVAEGYGLPLIEALDHKKPLLVRDIPIFREIVGAGANYFTDDSPLTFSCTIQYWLMNAKFTEVISNEPTRPTTWAQATIAIVHALGVETNTPQRHAVST